MTSCASSDLNTECDLATNRVRLALTNCGVLVDQANDATSNRSRVQAKPSMNAENLECVTSKVIPQTGVLRRFGTRVLVCHNRMRLATNDYGVSTEGKRT